jgi:hypothetical protein
MDNQDTLADNMNHSYYHSNFISIRGYREIIEPISYSQIKNSVNDLVNNIEICEDREASKVVLENAIIQQIKEKEIAKRSRQDPWVLDEMLNMHIDYSFYSGNCEDAQRHYNTSRKFYEKNYKTFTDEQEREQWLPRINIIDFAQTTNLIFTLSIIPYNPDTEQTWYYKRCFYSVKAIPENTVKLKKIFGGFVPSRIPTTSSGIKHDTIHEKITANDKNPEEICTGFFKPFPTFYSKKKGVQFDPIMLPKSIIVCNVFKEEELIYSLNKIINADLKEIVQKIILLFINDTHAKGLGLTILQSSPEKQLYFTKI